MQGKLAGYDVATSGLGQNGWGAGYLGEYGMLSALIFEIVATFLFVVTILGVTQPGAPSHMAGLAIGLMLVVIHIVGIKVTGVSVNPARSFGPALVAPMKALHSLAAATPMTTNTAYNQGVVRQKIASSSSGSRTSAVMTRGMSMA